MSTSQETELLQNPTDSATQVPAATAPPAAVPRRPGLLGRVAGFRLLGTSAVIFAALQAICPAVVAVSAIRVLIGLGALGAAGSDLTDSAWHHAWIRYPMLGIAGAGALLNLFVVWHVRRLRNRPAAQWRVGPVTAAKLRSEWLQIALAVLTFVLIGAELYVHG